MAGESNLRLLLQGMTPELDEAPYGIVVVKEDLQLPAGKTFALITEAEGTTVVAATQVLHASGYDVPSEWAHITLQIHSSLEAVGLTAAFAKALGNVGISANVIAGFHHDHIFVQWSKRHEAMSALRALSHSN
jgi:uncharacterized protein